MFVGHAALAFALVALAAHLAGVRPERALTVGLVAGAFAFVPDVDILYGPVGVVQLAVVDLQGATTLPAVVGTFWATGNEVHRGVTHSVVLAVPTAIAVWAWVRWLRARISLTGRGGVPAGASATACAVLALVLAAALVAGPAIHRGPLAGVVMLAALAGAGMVATAAATLSRLSPRNVGLAALTGLATHPFGDFLTGSPPAIAYPFGPVVGESHLVLHPDPTVHLLAAFLLELGVVWLAVVTAIHLRGGRVRHFVHRRATVGVGYAAVALALPAPTLDVSYHFVLSALAVGAVGATPRLAAVDEDCDAIRVPARRFRRFARARVRRPPLPTAVVTGLAAVTVAVLAYGAVYVGF